MRVSAIFRGLLPFFNHIVRLRNSNQLRVFVNIELAESKPVNDICEEKQRDVLHQT